MRTVKEMENIKINYPFEGYPRWVCGNDGLVNEVKIAPSISVKANKSGTSNVAIFVDDKPFITCVALVKDTTIEAWNKKVEDEIERYEYVDVNNLIEDGFHQIVTEISIDQEITGHASNLIEWIEAGCDPAHMDKTIALRLLPRLFGEEKAFDIRLGYLVEALESGHPGAILRSFDNCDISNDEINKILDNDKMKEIARKIVKWITVLGCAQVGGFVEFRKLYNIVGIDIMIDEIKKLDNDQKFDIIAGIGRLEKINLEKDEDACTRDLIKVIKSVGLEFNDEEIVQGFVGDNLDYFLMGVRSRSLEHDEKLILEKIVERAVVRYTKTGEVDAGFIRNRAEISNLIPRYYGAICTIKNDKKPFNNNHSESTSAGFGFSVGMEIEQCGKEGSACVSKNSNFLDLPTRLPVEVIKSTKENNKGHLDTGIDVKRRTYNGHYDPNGPWEFMMDHTTRHDDLIRDFDNAIKGNRWVWHDNWMLDGKNYSCSAHIHFSPVNCEWNDLWNFLVKILPLTAPFWIHGQRPRKQAFSGKVWAFPVVDTLGYDDVTAIFEGHVIEGESGHHYQYGHQYDVLAWNAHDEKKNVTIEFRLNEAHPYWSVRCLEAINEVFKLCGNPGKYHAELFQIENEKEVLSDLWALIGHEDVYVALSKSKPIKFVKEHGKKSYFNDLFKDEYANALEFFVDFCNKISVLVGDPAKKVLELYSELIDTGKIDASHVWNVSLIHDLYKELPEVFLNDYTCKLRTEKTG